MSEPTVKFHLAETAAGLANPLKLFKLELAHYSETAFHEPLHQKRENGINLQ